MRPFPIEEEQSTSPPTLLALLVVLGLFGEQVVFGEGFLELEVY